MIYILIAMLLYSCVIILGALASRNTSVVISAAITNLISALIPVSMAIPLIDKKTLSQDKKGIIFAFLTGIAIAFFVLSINKAYAANKVGIVAPMVFGGAIFVSTILSYAFLKEKVSTLQFGGLLILALGFCVITYARATGR